MAMRFVLLVYTLARTELQKTFVVHVPVTGEENDSKLQLHKNSQIGFLPLIQRPLPFK